jgi:hypothetical protein
MTDPFNPSSEPLVPEYEPGQGDPSPFDPGGPDVLPDPGPQEIPQFQE